MQRAIVNQATNIVFGHANNSAGDEVFNTDVFVAVDMPDGTIPDGQPDHAYELVAGVVQRRAGNSWKKPEEVERDQANQDKSDLQTLRTQLQTEIGALPNSPQKAILVNLMQLIAALVRLARAE